MEILNKLLRERNQCNDPVWRVQESNYGGRGLFAVRNIKAGEIIFKDYPSVIGPRTSDDLPGCSVCLTGGRPLTACSNGCGLPVCYGRQCEQQSVHRKDCKLLKQLMNQVQMEPGQWSAKLYKTLTLLRCLYMPEKEKDIIKLMHTNKDKNTQEQISQLKHCLLNALTEEEESWLLHCCGVLDGTSFEVPHKEGESWSLRGLYPLASMMNHCCTPNTRHNYSVGLETEETGGPTMLVTASMDIAEDVEITTTYCPQLWSTPARRHFLLMTKQFLCNCCRCQDPTEFGTYLSALNCPCTKGILLPVCSLDMDSVWVCNSCSGTTEAKKVFAVQRAASRMGLRERYFLLPPTNYIIVQAKLESIWKAVKNISSLSNDELSLNASYIRELLQLLNQLRLGKSRMSGLLLMEFYKTIDELTKRNDNEINQSEELTRIWTEANSILEGDLVAPKIRRH